MSLRLRYEVARLRGTPFEVALLLAPRMLCTSLLYFTFLRMFLCNCCFGTLSQVTRTRRLKLDIVGLVLTIFVSVIERDEASDGVTKDRGCRLCLLHARERICYSLQLPFAAWFTVLSCGVAHGVVR